MKKNTLSAILVSAIIFILAAAVVILLIFIKNQPEPNRGILPMVTVEALEPDSSIWGKNFPNQYSTMLQTAQNEDGTVYGGSYLRNKLETDPRLLTLFAGYAFSKEYNEDRGHENAVTDVNESLRINDKTPGTCYSCKSSDNPRLWQTMGVAAYDATPFATLGQDITHSIGCANCHEANTMKLVVTNPALDTALKAQGLDWTTFTRQEMRSVVCANCHVEYYMAGDGKLLTLPWENGTKIEEIAQYYTDINFKDWVHPDSGAAIVKMQHPDYELYTAGSTHYNAGVACADCHMPYTRDGSVKFSTHNIKSPLLNLAPTCGTCHTDVEYVAERVKIIQNSVSETMGRAEDALVAAIAAIKLSAASANADQTLIAEAQELQRQSQLRWDFIAAENSMGFHNPEEALRILADSIDLARQAESTALRAAK